MRIILYVTLFLFLNFCGSKKDIEDIEGVKETQNIEDTQDTKNDQDMKDTQDTKDDPDMKDAKDAKDDPDMKDAKNTKDDPETKDAQDTEDAQNDPGTRDTQDTKDDPDTRDTQDTGFTFNTDELSESPQPISHIIEGRRPVKKYSEYYTSGFIVGTFLKASEKGWFFDTKEVQVGFGHFPGTGYIGELMDMSIDGNDENIFNQLLQLSPQQVYVFEYKKAHRFDWEIEDTHYHILNATPLNKEFGMNYTSVVKASSIEKKGYYSSGERRGKVILVQRWGMWDIDCSFTLHVGGRGHRYTKVLPDFNVYSEEGCRFVEEALKAGKDVVVKYSEDYVEVWDLYSKIAEEITLVN